MNHVRLYGRELGKSSLAVVTEGFRSVLEESGLLVGFYGVDTDGADEYSTPDGVSARHGVYVGPMSRIHEMFRQGLHQHYWIMLAPNSNLLPDDLVRMLKSYRDKHYVHFMAPSAWAAEVVRDHLDECIVVPHGVTPQAIPDDSKRVAAYADGEFRVLHFSTSARERKGTFELLRAWQLFVKIWPNAELWCVMDYEATLAIREKLFDEEMSLPHGVKIYQRMDMQLAEVYSQVHVVCQPSRGEAFGLCPLEALSVGTPIVATACAGHSEYLGFGARIDDGGDMPPGSVLIPTGDWTAIDDLPGSQAPSVDPDDIDTALSKTRHYWPELRGRARANAEQIQNEWAWKEKLGGFVELLRNT